MPSAFLNVDDVAVRAPGSSTLDAATPAAGSVRTWLLASVPPEDEPAEMGADGGEAAGGDDAAGTAGEPDVAADAGGTATSDNAETVNASTPTVATQVRTNPRRIKLI